MILNTKIKDIVWYQEPVKIDVDYQNFKEGQEISFDIISVKDNENSKNDVIKTEMNILIDEIKNNKIVLDVIAVQNYSNFCNEYIKFVFMWYFSDNYQIENMKIINSKLIIPTQDYTDSIVNFIKQNLFLNTPVDYNNKNILNTITPDAKYNILSGYSKISSKRKPTLKKKAESHNKMALKNLKTKITGSSLINSITNYEINREINHENISNNYSLNHDNKNNISIKNTINNISNISNINNISNISNIVNDL